MRFSYLVPRVIIVAILWGFLAFAFDPLMRRAVVTSGQRLTGAKVNVTALRTSLPSLSLSLSGVQIANRSVPGTNLLQFHTLDVRLSRSALFDRALVIEDGAITGLQWGTNRSDSGRLDLSRPSTLSLPGGIGTLLDGVSRTGTDWLAGLAEQAKQKLDPEKLESVQMADRLRQEWDQRFRKLESRIKKLEPRVRQIERDVRRARGNPFERISIYQRAAAETDQVLAEVERLRREIARLPLQAHMDLRAIDNARRRDQRALQQTLHALRFDAASLSESLIGPELSTRISQVSRWMIRIQTAVAEARNRPRPRRLRGTDIPFSRREPTPAMLILRLHLSGTTPFNGRPMPFQGTVTGITSDPTLYGRPVVVTLSGGDRNQMHATAVFDYTHAVPVNRLEVTAADSEAIRLRLGDSQSLALTLNADRAVYRARLTLTGDRLDGEIAFHPDNVHLTAETIANGRDEILRAVQTAVSSVRTIKASLRLTGTLAHPRWAVHSTLGPQLAGAMNRAVSTELAARQRQLSVQVDQIVRRRADELTKTLNSRYADLTAKLTRNEELARNTVRKLTGGRALKLDRLFR